jgi:O-antigen ligase
MLPVALLPVCGLLQVQFGLSVDAFVTSEYVVRYGSVACAFLLGAYAFSSRKVNRLFRFLVIALGTALAVFAIAQMATSNGRVYWTFPPPPNSSILGPFLNRDHYCAFIELVLPLALWEAVRNTRSAWLFGAPAALMYASVIAGLSRAGSILATLEVLAIILPALAARRRASAGNRTRAIAAAALIVFFATFVGWEELIARFDDKDPYAGRREFARSSLLMIRDKPLTGFGLGSWLIVYPRYAVMDMGMETWHAHNDWMEWACDGGIPFLVLMLIPAVRASWLSLRFPWGLGVMAASMHATVDFPFQRYATLLLFFLLIAALDARNRETAGANKTDL